MAQYERPAADVAADIDNSGLNPSTKSAIAAVVGTEGDVGLAVYDGTPPPPGTLVLDVPADVPLNEDPGTPIIIMDADSGGITGNSPVDFDASPGGRALVAGGGDDNILFTGNGNVTVETGGGSDTVVTGGGDDLIVITGTGDSSVYTGGGSDTVIVTGDGSSTINTGSGNDVIILSSDSKDVTIDGGDGFDRVEMDDSRANHQFTYEDGVLVLNSSRTELMNVQVVEFVDGISILTESANQAIIGRLYQVMFGREADLAGLEYWLGRLESGTKISHIGNAFMDSDEFRSIYDTDSDAEFLTKLYDFMAERAPDDAGLAYWLNELESGARDRSEVARSFAASEEAIELMGIDGTQYIIDPDIA